MSSLVLSSRSEFLQEVQKGGMISNKNKGDMALRKEKLQDRKEAHLQRKREKAEEAGS